MLTVGGFCEESLEPLLHCDKIGELVRTKSLNVEGGRRRSKVSRPKGALCPLVSHDECDGKHIATTSVVNNTKGEKWRYVLECVATVEVSAEVTISD